MTAIKMLTADEKVAEIRRLYFQTTRHTIQQDLDRALGLLKSLNGEDERERATVYMEGRPPAGAGGARPDEGGLGSQSEAAEGQRQKGHVNTILMTHDFSSAAGQSFDVEATTFLRAATRSCSGTLRSIDSFCRSRSCSRAI